MSKMEAVSDSTRRCLFQVHSRVNSLKYMPDLVEDLITTHRKMEEAWKALLGIYDLFSYIGMRRGASKQA